MDLVTVQLSLHGAPSYGFTSMDQHTSGNLCVTSWQCSLTVFLCYPMGFLCTKMLSQPDRARTSPVKLTDFLQALNLGIAVPRSLGSWTVPIIKIKHVTREWSRWGKEPQLRHFCFWLNMPTSSKYLNLYIVLFLTFDLGCMVGPWKWDVSPIQGA